MAEQYVNDVEKLLEASDSHDIRSLLSSPLRDYLVRNSGDQAKTDVLKGKTVGLYFSASWRADRDAESFNKYFSKMPWVAVPFSDSDTRDKLRDLFSVRGLPHLVLLDENGKVLTSDGVQIIEDHGLEGYPFTPQHVKELKEQDEVARRDQSLTSILESHLRNFVISNDGKEMPVTELEGKTIGLHFSLSSFSESVVFTEKLVKVYNELKEKGESFEIVTVPLDIAEESFNKGLEGAPWFSLPFKDSKCEKLTRHFKFSTFPTLVILGPDGKTLHLNVADAVKEHGSLAYPFTPKKFSELEEIEKAKRENQTLESILVSEEQDFVIAKDGIKVPVSDLVGKHILFYFSAHWCPPCRVFTPKLIEIYHNIKSKYDGFELIFISFDQDQTSFDEYFNEMPWLAVPFGDTRKASLSTLFKIRSIPKLVAIETTGKTITTEAQDLVMLHGADTYPFTEQRIREIEVEHEEMAKGWPQKVKHALHMKHEMVLTRYRIYLCHKCAKDGKVWAFRCEECNFDLHPECALEEDKESKEEDIEKGENSKEGRVCDGGVYLKSLTVSCQTP
ncbi:putative nucleoredoxin 1 [Heracleum sosnowskyi]|uniref:protein-disulfide reductase n=1 Tax=Heracleum sosnowskyi TaxID=360622 RepID=A0AAD8MKX3_9APIA|nr:putative nucleoredoxin 1 [Heracleum sosnowskyi]